MNPKVWPAAILIIALAFRLLLFTGVQGNDDRLYSSSAWQMARGEKQAGPDLFRTRVAYVVPVALLYKAFGAHPSSLLLPNLVASLAIVGLALRLGHVLFGPVVGRAAGFIAAICPLDIFYATMGGTDPLLAAFIGAGVWLLIDPVCDRKPLCAAAAGLAWGGAHLTKESGLLLLLPVVPILLARAEPRSRLVAGAVVAGVLAVEALVYAMAQGDPLYRIHIAQVVLKDPSDPYPGLGARLALFPSICLNPLGGLFPYTGGWMAIAAAGAAWAFARDRRRAGPLAGWWLATGLLLCLFPSSLFPYKAALQLQPRMLAALTLPGAVLAAAVLVEIVGATAPRRAWAVGVVASALSLACAVRIHQDGIFWRSSLEWGRDRVAEHPGSTVVTDPRSAETLMMMFGYAPPATIRSYGPGDPVPVDGTLLLDLSAHAALSRARDGVEAPAWWTAPTSRRTTVAQEDVPGRRRIRGGPLPGEKRVLSRMGF